MVDLDATFVFHPATKSGLIGLSETNLARFVFEQYVACP